MATSKQVEPEPSVESAVQQITGIEVEGEGEGDPLEGLGNKQIAEIYHKLSPEDRQLFRQFKSFHKLHYDLYGHDAPSHQLARGIIQRMFSGIPAQDAEVIAAARAEILAAERLKDLCKQLGLAGTQRVTAKMKSGGTRVPSTSSTTMISLLAGRTATAAAAASTAYPSTQYLRGGHQTRCKATPTTRNYLFGKTRSPSHGRSGRRRPYNNKSHPRHGPPSRI